MQHTDVTGRLENWHYDPYGRDILWGKIFGDKYGRWADGQLIHTSSINECRGFKEGDIVKTLNSSYLLGKRNK